MRNSCYYDAVALGEECVVAQSMSAGPYRNVCCCCLSMSGVTTLAEDELFFSELAELNKGTTSYSEN
jgi:hypothetical protein